MNQNAAFTKLADATGDDFQIINRRYPVHVDALPDTLFTMLKRLASDTCGHTIDRLQTALRTATRAFRYGADEGMPIVALLHDVGDGIAPEYRAEIGAAFLKPRVSAGSYWLLKHHAVFQACHWWHLVDRDACEANRGHPMFERTVHFCAHWDRISFDPNCDTIALALFAPMVRRILAREP